ncbi:3-phytase [Roseateles sp. YR242]|uniref:phytase n=1 Tax=Roseateles sp. YR242 TaxID=1855305 RepID=UPI0008BC5330|nr:phytase [Roseateles sp. YR242]SEK79771.1 3-phytase [Roseateles sp. YR242]
MSKTVTYNRFAVGLAATAAAAAATAVLMAFPGVAAADTLELARSGLRLVAAPSGAKSLVASEGAGEVAGKMTGMARGDSPGEIKAELPMRAKRWDQRRLPDGRTVALVQDADSGALRLIEARNGTLLERRQWEGPAFNVEALCLYLPADQPLLQVFLLGDDGMGEQWLLDDEAGSGRSASRGSSGSTGATSSASLPASPVMRHLATAPDAKGCAVRDDEARLYVAEAGVGLWAQSADAERHERQLVASGLAPADLPHWLATHAPTPRPSIPVAVPSAQTVQVRGGGDAADDPAIWVNTRQPSASRILGTDKKLGLAVYDLQGRETQFLPVGRVNNVDLRQGLRYERRDWDLAVASQRDRRTVVLFQVNAQGHVSPVAELPTGLEDVYGICSGRNASGGLDVFVNDKDGRVVQLRVTKDASRWQGRQVGQFKLDTQPEGCVVDEAGQQLFIGEEKRGIWRVALEADGRMGAASFILPVGELLAADVEGMAVHRSAGGAWLVVSSQGNDSFVMLSAEAPYAVKGRFRVGLNARFGIDAVSETDGLDVTSANLGGVYGEGLLVVQDGHKRWPSGRQNFKLVPWGEVMRTLERAPAIAGVQ